ncbi:hypothetical protein [Nocardia cyriacigeorgica]|uniref:hypothetical protein n=1 Tax=Nocardia cyriacigeorgica TaxID=135487 RepID=UPI00131A335C|nr:hypothetical protein [Nocardia cyriacigeorgica]
MTDAVFHLEDGHLAKGLRYMRELRRAIDAYWYATIEDREAAALEARRVTSAVNILDEAVFLNAYGDIYRQHRAGTTLGKVVMGLELIRNCEEHAPVVFDDLLVPGAHYGVPLSMAPTRMRVVYDWAKYSDMPDEYVCVDPSATERIKRARAEAQDAYHKQVQGRPVIDTMFDAVRFFQELDPQLIAGAPPVVRWAFAESTGLEPLVEVPDTDTRTELPTKHLVCRPMGMDQYEVFLSDIACRPADRRSAQWPAWDTAVRTRKVGILQQAKDRNPPGSAREVRYRLMENRKVIGYSGVVVGPSATSEPWVERTRQIAKDVGRGFTYFVRSDEISVHLQPVGNGSVAAISDDRDVLGDLADAGKRPGMDVTWLKLLEENPDLYLVTRPRQVPEDDMEARPTRSQDADDA